MKRLDVFIDYQNVHLTAHGIWCSDGGRLHECIVSPIDLATAIERRLRGVELQRCLVYRGRPDPRRQPKLTGFTDREIARWQQDSRVSVRTRPLRYPSTWGQTGGQPASEKGIDVLLSVELVERALDGAVDVCVVFTHDSDFLPAVELASRRGAELYIASWSGANRLRSVAADLRQIVLGRDDFAQSPDRDKQADGVWPRVHGSPS